ncbi:RND transporter [Lampropedia cohaerens]|uniref:RND transporter n=1 Tax=Lampropedia cohaerens TaxID=1610491 RepID=A0A0U1Q0V1_9BURK|nr:efflux transporter outer membrane subunit [Lampropedia cohaerens]KKW68225.1 RND transporter [Lampropedia cohaerens]
MQSPDHSFLLRSAVALLCAVIAGCALPDRRAIDAAVQMPASYPYTDSSNGSFGAAVADAHWRAYFSDPRLQQLIEIALAHNRDLRTAVLRVQQARASYGVQRSAQWPTLGASGEASRARTPGDLSPLGSATTASQYQLGVGISSWEIDFWGRIASLNEVALQSFLATDAARRAATVALIAQVADAYFGLRELQERLDLAHANERNQRESLRIFTRRFEVGAISRLELTQMQTLMAQAQSLVLQLQQQRDAQRLALGILLGGSVDPANLPPAGSLADDVALLPLVQPGLPSDLLQRRPDIVAAEHQLRAAQANIEAARAAFFPRISLTAFGGTASNELDGLFHGANRAWSFVPNLSLPIFDGGRNRANLDLAEVRTEMAVVDYEQTIQNAFRDVADALSAQHWLVQQADVRQRDLQVQQERARLSRLSYDSGASSFLEVLDAERDLIAAEQQLAQTRRALLASRVALYAALGGGAPPPDGGQVAVQGPAASRPVSSDMHVF